METKKLNPEQLILQVGDTIADFVRHHNTACILGILDGVVIARTREQIKTRDQMHDGFIEIQELTRWQCVNGLTNAQWDALGERLYFELYGKDPKK